MPQRVDISSIRDAIAVVRRLLQLFRFQLQEPNAHRKLRRLSQRLLNLSQNATSCSRKARFSKRRLRRVEKRRVMVPRTSLKIWSMPLL